MDWWKKLKGWQKAGIIVGGIHFVVYMTVLLLFPPVWVYFLLYMELPWQWLFWLIGYDPVTNTGMGLMGLLGTFLYASCSMIIAWLLTTKSQNKS